MKGELEQDVSEIGFRSLTILRPSILEGERDEVRLAESLVLKLSTFPCESPSETIPSIPLRKSPKCSSMQS